MGEPGHGEPALARRRRPCAFDRYAERGLMIVTEDNGRTRPATREELGVTEMT